MNKKIIIALIALLTILVIGLTSIFIYLLANGFKFNLIFGSEYKKVVFDKSYDNNVENIIIENDIGGIHIKQAKDNQIKVEITGKDKKEYLKKIKVSSDNNILNIKVDDGNRNFFNFNAKYSRITIYLPKNYDKKMSIKTDIGNIYVDSFAKLNLSAISETGNISISKAKNINANCDMGNIKIKNALNYVNIKNNMGNIKINNLNITKDSTIKNDMGNIIINKTNDIYINAKTNLGNNKVKGSNRKSDITLTIKNSMGNISVNS